jgi:hypothetical protein
MSERSNGWPKSADELKALGYGFQEWGNCRSCGARVAWVRTNTGNRMPMVEVERPLFAAEGERYFQSHFADCKQAQDWRRR